IPRIAAASHADAYFALGFVHAQDRLFQMELMRRTGQGRLAEVIGRPGLGTDRFMRTLGLYRLAEDAVAALDPGAREAVERYAAGVNAFLSDGGPLPPEFQMLMIDPEPWRPADSLVWQKLMGLQLSGNWGEELLRAQLNARLGPDRAMRLFPDASRIGPATVAVNERLARELSRLVWAAAPPTLASNIWAIAPTRTATRGAILANDPHLNFSAPNLWYLAVLSYPGVTLTGATVPGVPFHLLGHNGKLAWGFTTTHGDTQDLFVEAPAGDGQYITPDGPRAFETRAETINVRFGEPETLTVRATRHGPVISDLLEPAERASAGGPDAIIALSATLFAPDDKSSSGIYRMARAETVAAFMAAAEDFHAPQQNVMAADTEGSIGYLAAGRMPMRAAGCDGQAPADGASGACDWRGWVPFAELPRRIDPADGVLINANNRIVGPDYPHLIAADWPEGYRAQRIADTIADRAGVTLAETARLQHDSVSLMARDLTPLMLGLLAPVADQDRDLAMRLAAWDGSAVRDRIEPLLFTLWLEKLKAAVLADDLGEVFAEFRGERPALIRAILTTDTAWCDDVRTTAPESCADQANLAWREALAWLRANRGDDPAGWRWGEVHIARFAHPIFPMIPGLRELGSFAIATDGDNFTVNRGSPSASSSAAPFRHRHGAGYRAVYDLADLNRSQFSLAGGQSGHPLSPNVEDLLVDWRDGNYLRIAPQAPRDARALVLEPGG
ncbi:MAG: penicillin acylase family protein, partial [Rhodospirillaceae bacterium]|nr:penicillin acylase family protein [Rhodospirillaceae bacterium]